MFIFCSSGKGQTKTARPIGNIKPETKDLITSHAPDRITRTIIQDRKGNIWIASFGGIFRYDGTSFTNITSKLSPTSFFAVLEDRAGNFWFSSTSSGVYYYNGKSFRNFTTREGLANNRVTAIYEDKTGNIWFGTEDGASCYDGKSFRTLLPYNNINAIFQDKTGKFWFGTRGNACFYDGKTFTDLTCNGKPFTNVRTIIEDKKGNIWTSSETDNGQGWALSRYDEQSLFSKKTTVTETDMTSKTIFGIFEDNDGNIWYGSNGVYRYDGNTITDFRSKGSQQ